MDKKIKGVIVSEYPFEDNSKIINIFTENGLLGVIAKGAKKVRSPFFSTTTKFNYGSFNINYKENGLSLLIVIIILRKILLKLVMLLILLN